MKRFPKEWELLRCQIDTAKKVEKMRFNPYVFTEQGIAMLSGLLNSDIAINVNIQIMRVFVQLRHYVVTKEDTNEQIAELRKLLMLYIEKNDKRVNDIIIALNNLLEHPKPTRRIGFNTDD
ncbi:ORF6N domain-containing protein [Treponema sp. R8-4-B8]